MNQLSAHLYIELEINYSNHSRNFFHKYSIYAEGGTRTLMELPPADFESAASTNSTTSAAMNAIYFIPAGVTLLLQYIWLWLVPQSFPSHFQFLLCFQ